VRYHTCQFLLNRPILYSLLHESIERCATPPETGAKNADEVGDFDNWIYERSRVCLRSALLLIMCLRMTPQLVGWCEMQTLLASYAVILQMQMYQPLHIFNGVDPDGLLDTVEDVFDAMPIAFVDKDATNNMMRNVRGNMRKRLQNPQSTPGSDSRLEAESGGLISPSPPLWQ
jgi:hypothetical protein